MAALLLGCAAGDDGSARPPETSTDAAHETQPGTADPIVQLADPDSDSGTDGGFGLPDADPGAPAAQLSLGHAHTCALLVDGTVRCWGQNVAGELGDGTFKSRGFSYPLLYLNDVVEVAVATQGHRSCARRTDGTVNCWGEVDDFGFRQCTLDAPPISVGCIDWPLPFPSPKGIVGVGVGADTCVRFADGNAECIGATPGPVEMLSNVAQLSFGSSHGCARLYDGTVSCWGDGALGQLGTGSTESCTSKLGINPCSSVPVVIKVYGVAQIASGDSHTCALLTDGTVQCWGASYEGQVGFGAIDNCTKYSYPCAKTPRTVVGLSSVTQIAAGGQHTCARLLDGTVQCWGNDADGQLGFNATERCNGAEEEPCGTRAKPVPGLDHVAEIALGRRHSCARLEDGSVKCWGWNGFGQLGDGTTKSHVTPTLVKL